VRHFGLGVVLFLAHLGLIVFHTWVRASDGNTLPIPPPPAAVFHPDVPDHWGNALDLNRWDSVLYAHIVENGYRDATDPGRASHTIMWFPGYPLVAWLVRQATGWKTTLVFSLLSAACTLGFWLLLWSPLVVETLGRRVLAVASVLIVSWPGAFFWFDGMPEPMALFLFMLAIHCWLARRLWALALVLGLATGVKQFFAVVSLAFLLLELWETRRITGSLVTRSLLSISGLLLFVAYCALAFGDPLVHFRMVGTYYRMGPSLMNLLDPRHLVRAWPSIGGKTMAVSLGVLALSAVPCLKGPRPHAGLWWLAAAVTAFFFSSAAPVPYSMLRHQTMNAPLALVAALMFTQLRPRLAVALLVPLAVLGLVVQSELTVDYWMWRWVA
jgi:hypothetical protein